MKSKKGRITLTGKQYTGVAAHIGVGGRQALIVAENTEELAAFMEYTIGIGLNRDEAREVIVGSAATAEIEPPRPDLTGGIKRRTEVCGKCKGHGVVMLDGGGNDPARG